MYNYFVEQRTTQIIQTLSALYPNAVSELNYSNPFELMIAVILSAQCTDKRVNIITDKLFKEANTPQQFVDMSLERLESFIKSCNYYHTKAKHIKQACIDLINKFDGKVPNELEKLVILSGVGRKTANVIMAVAFNKPAIAVDTHVFRVSNRLAIVSANNVLDCEKQLMKQIDKNLWCQTHHYLLLFGRYICKSANPDCDNCPLTQFCINKR